MLADRTDLKPSFERRLVHFGDAIGNMFRGRLGEVLGHRDFTGQPRLIPFITTEDF